MNFFSHNVKKNLQIPQNPKTPKPRVSNEQLVKYQNIK